MFMNAVRNVKKSSVIHLQPVTLANITNRLLVVNGLFRYFSTRKL